MPVGAVVRAGNDTVETPFSDAVGEFRLQCVVRAVTDLRIGLYAVFLHLTGHDIDDASHCIGAVQH